MQVNDSSVHEADGYVHERNMQELGGHKRMVGIGLGNVAKRIHRIYRNGEITIDSKEGTGTIVTLTLPQDKWYRVKDQTGMRDVQDTDRG